MQLWQYLSYLSELLFAGTELEESTLQLVEIYFDTATFDDIERDRKIKTEAQLSLIGGTMGLFSGFSIISGIEIIFFVAKFLSKSLINFMDKYRNQDDNNDNEVGNNDATNLPNTI